ncbi:chlorophyll synthesis pathway protein BchC [Sediminicoccus sp. KRV36]|uniref:chlorophyll synthesis pathway protein BchC n=1 Tax=Sediminicoccus sp. KRV36 TaxID=3133721 RepID=UPI00200D1A8F|nr:chlorophyll synthesis pathway protein BchC [Sediminicoccus rosea]
MLQRVDLLPPGEADVVVHVEWSGISTGTEKLLWLGKMPNFPGMGYPLVPGYESVGRIVEAGPSSGQTIGSRVFIPGSRGFRDVRGLFGGAAGCLVTPGARVIPVDEALGDKAILLALAATAYHAIVDHPPELIIGHGVLGRLLARITIAMGHPAPNVWELSAERAEGAEGYTVLTPESDTRRDYARICDASGDSNILDSLVSRLRAGGEITLAGFYDRLSFAFAPAFMREASLRIAAEWQAQDMASLNALITAGKLSLDHLITHRQSAGDAPDAYRTAFGDARCLKMVLDWRTQA